ncbi:MAG: zinc ribbon domain-containing protein [Chloroflexi bacterium]|nr:zinc ribbon domain-containing protein [Chloroflexota bacterium]
MMGGWGMMGGWDGSARGGWGVWGWILPLIGLLIPLAFLALLALGGVWLFRQSGLSRNLPPASEQDASGKTCPSCGRPVQADWQVCPYCGQGLV